MVLTKGVEQFRGIVLIGELAFDRREPCAGRGVEALEKGTLREERGQIRGKLQSALPTAASAATAGTLRNISARSGRMNEKR